MVGWRSALVVVLLPGWVWSAVVVLLVVMKGRWTGCRVVVVGWVLLCRGRRRWRSRGVGSCLCLCLVRFRFPFLSVVGFWGGCLLGVIDPMFGSRGSK